MEPERPKLIRIWHLVLLRALVEGLLLLPFLRPDLQALQPATWVIAGAALGGGVLELLMYWRMRGHPFQGILRFNGIVGLIAGVVLLTATQFTIHFLIFVVGVWITLRGFAGLWLGLSIIERPLDRAIPAGAGLVAVGFGVWLMWLQVGVETFALLLFVYGLGSTLMHLALGLRILFVGGRRLTEEGG